MDEKPDDVFLAALGSYVEGGMSCPCSSIDVGVILYKDPGDAFLAALGAGEIVFSDSTHDVVDVTIILGADLGLPLSGGPTPGGLSE